MTLDFFLCGIIAGFNKIYSKCKCFGNCFFVIFAEKLDMFAFFIVSQLVFWRIVFNWFWVDRKVWGSVLMGNKNRHQHLIIKLHYKTNHHSAKLIIQQCHMHSHGAWSIPKKKETLQKRNPVKSLRLLRTLLQFNSTELCDELWTAG